MKKAVQVIENVDGINDGARPQSSWEGSRRAGTCWEQLSRPLSSALLSRASSVGCLG